MVLLSGILSRNVGSVRVQSWTGGFSSTGGKRHIGEGKVIPPSLAQQASVGGTNGGEEEAGRPENTGAIYSPDLVTTFLYSPTFILHYFPCAGMSILHVLKPGFN